MPRPVLSDVQPQRRGQKNVCELPANIFDVLEVEHTLILAYLGTLSSCIRKLDAGKRPPVEIFEHACVFTREFIDRYHHFKEEHVLFERLARLAQGALDGTIDALRRQHEDSREDIEQVVRSLESYAEGDARSTAVIRDSLATHVATLHDHISREERVFLPAAREVLASRDLQESMAEFRRAEEAAGNGFLGDMRARVAKMEAILTHG